MDVPRYLQGALDKLKPLRPADWSIEIVLLQPERGDDPQAYDSKISWHSPAGIVVVMQHSNSVPGSEYSKEIATISIMQTYADGSPPDNVFSGTYEAFAHSHDDHGAVVPVFAPLAQFILGVTEGVRRGRAQRCVEARRAFFGS